MQDLVIRQLASPILVVAPHPDDDILSSAGLIQKAIQAGKTVSVVFMTVGDGFADSLREVLHIPVSTKSYRKLGEIRYHESVQALRMLGVPRGKMYFLGFPDGILRRLNSNPEHRFLQSPYTKVAKVPYSFAVRKGTVYSRNNAIRSIREVLARVRPGTLILPHRMDTHPDHAATRKMTLAALRSSELRPRLYSYVIHYPNYPNWSGALVPPRSIPRNVLYRVRLSTRQKRDKMIAFSRHRSQYTLCRRILRLIRTEEWFVRE